MGRTHHVFLHETRSPIPVVIDNQEHSGADQFCDDCSNGGFLFGSTDLVQDQCLHVLPSAQGVRHNRASEQVRDVV